MEPWLFWNWIDGWIVWNDLKYYSTTRYLDRRLQFDIQLQIISIYEIKYIWFPHFVNDIVLLFFI